MGEARSRGALGDGIAGALLAEAERRGLTLRLGGSWAIREHCPPTARLLERWDRAVPGDVDLFGRRAQERALQEMFGELGYVLDPAVAYSQEYGVDRLVYRREGAAKVDVFLDVLRMSHTVELGDRLELTDALLTLADLVLTKLQIHELNHKDVVDLAALLAEHELAEEPRDEAIDTERIAGVLARDWGFWHTAMLNLDTVAHFLGSCPPEDDARGRALDRLAQLRRRIESRPKSMAWRMRARIGTRVRWYQDVDDVGQGGF